MSNVTELQPKQALRLHCSACGAVADATCDCGVGYMSAGEFAAKAVAEHPEMSNRAIAEKTGVAEATVRRARQSAASNDAPQTRTGLDGKQYPTAVDATTKLAKTHPAEKAARSPSFVDVERAWLDAGTTREQLVEFLSQLPPSEHNKWRAILGDIRDACDNGLDLLFDRKTDKAGDVCSILQ